MIGFFSDGRSKIGCDTKGREDSPDSVITQGTNFSVFSSATASIGRSSCESDGRERDSSVSAISKHLAGRDRKGASRALDLDPNRDSATKSSPKDARKKDNAQRGEDAGATKYSFSDALKECQKRRLKPEKKRTNSLDLNNPADAHESPRLGSMVLQQQQQKKSSASSRKSATSASPDTPSLRTVLTQQKGTTGPRRTLNVPAGQIYHGKSLPSKWEDAERWIFSPDSNEASNPNRPSIVPPRKPKSKSGPLAVVGSGYRPSVPVPCTARVPSSTQFQFSHDDGIVEAGSQAESSSHNEPCIVRSASVHGCSDLVMQPTESPAVKMNKKPDGTKDAATMISPAVSRRDMATQMSPEASSIHSSPRKRDSSPSSLHPPVLTIMELQKIRQLSKLEVRDVEVDDRISMTSRRSKRLVDRLSIDVGEWKKKTTDSRASAWEVSETAKRVSKCKKEEAKITAWENLQKAKAEAQIRKLEVKLEKLRTSSMEKIMNKLRSAQRKAQEMRMSVSAIHAQRVAKTAEKARTFRRATGHMGPLIGWFICHAS